METSRILWDTLLAHRCAGGAFEKPTSDEKKHREGLLILSLTSTTFWRCNCQGTLNRAGGKNLVFGIENEDGSLDGSEWIKCFGRPLREIDHSYSTSKGPINPSLFP